MKIIGVVFNDEYDPVLDKVDAIANELGISSSFLILDIICEAFNLMPVKEPILYKKHNIKNI